jgi:hypothetical protein
MPGLGATPPDKWGWGHAAEQLNQRSTAEEDDCNGREGRGQGGAVSAPVEKKRVKDDEQGERV